jgi:alpha-beta hydrolase superfamily lysophospholipase
MEHVERLQRGVVLAADALGASAPLLVAAAAVALVTVVLLARCVYLAAHRYQHRQRKFHPKTPIELALITDPRIDYRDAFITRHGREIYRQIFAPATREAVACVVFLHGIGADTVSSLEEHALELVEEGIAIIGFDFEGHGRSSGTHGYFSLEQCLRDTREMVQSVQETPELAKLPIFLVGVSLGGHLALQYARRHPDHLAGIVCLCPPVTLPPGSVPPAPVVAVGHVLAHVFPELPLTTSNDDGWTDKEAQAEYRKHPLAYRGRMRVHVGVQLKQSIEDLERNMHEVRVPMLILHGKQDLVVPVSGSQRLYEIARSEDKELIVYDECNHVLLREPEGRNARVVQDLKRWIVRRSSSGGGKQAGSRGANGSGGGDDDPSTEAVAGRTRAKARRVNGGRA